MKLEVLAEALQSVYSNGRVKSAKKLDREDFIIITIAAVGSFMRRAYYEEKNVGSITSYFGNILNPVELGVKKDEHHRKYSELEGLNLVKLPDGAGIFSVTPVDNEGYINESAAFTRLQPGMDWLYTTDDLEDLGIQTYQVLSNRILYKNMFEETEKVEVQGIFLNENFEIPEDIAYSIMNDIFTKVVPLQGFPIDKTDDGNPNLIEYKRRLAEQEQL